MKIILCLAVLATSTCGMEKMVGGASELKAPDDAVITVVQEIKPKVEEKLGKTFSVFEPVGYRSQVVAGKNYFVKVKVSDEEFLHLRIYQNLQRQLELSNLQTGHSTDSELAYF